MSNDETKKFNFPKFNLASPRRSLKRAIAILFIFAVAAVSTVTIQTNLEQVALPAYADAQRPVRSMVFVRRSNNISFVSCIPESEAPGRDHPCTLFNDRMFRDQVVTAMNMQFGFSITGSASLVGHDISRSSSYILSAYHVCRDFDERFLAIKVSSPEAHTLLFKYVPAVTLTDFYGNEYEAEEIRGDINNDICLLGTTGLMENIEPIRIASEPPQAGDRIYNIASPHGLSQPGAVLSYEGYHAGTIGPTRTIRTPHYLNAIPTAPGSSGSPILNEAGEIISVTSYGYIQRPHGPVPPHDMWPNASAGPSLEMIKRIVMPRIIQ